MRGLAAFVMKGRGQAVSAACFFALFSAFVPFLGLLASAAVALPTLRRGAYEGGLVWVGALLATCLVDWALSGFGLRAVGYGLLLWVPVWLAALALRTTSSLALALACIVGLGVLAVLAVYGFFPDPAALWVEMLHRFTAPLLEQAQNAEDAEQVRRNLAYFSRFMTGIAAAASAFTLMLSLLIARWWQALLYNPGGFRAEFLRLRMPGSAGFVLLASLGLAAVGSEGMAELAMNLVTPLFVLFLLGGLSLLHVWLAGKGGGFWLAGIYMALLFIPHVVLPIALLGLSDAWLDWRHRRPGG